jgi:NAD(P)-dependent dehydrogenase (short-subunit alcohol dehydrogenase family)
MNDFQLFLENKPEHIDRVIAVNLGGALHLRHALLPAMVAAGGDKIVGVATDAGRVRSTGETVYAAAKAGLIGFTKSLAREMARCKINVNCVCPGPTDTPMLQSRPDKIKDAFIRAIAFRRLGSCLGGRSFTRSSRSATRPARAASSRARTPTAPRPRSAASATGTSSAPFSTTPG